MTFLLTGLDIDAKADLVRRQLAPALEGSRPSSGRWHGPTTTTRTPTSGQPPG